MDLKWVKAHGPWDWALQAPATEHCRNKARILEDGTSEIWNEGNIDLPMWIPIKVDGLTLEEKKALLLLEYKLQ
jgi:hypothetical protein